MLPTKLDYSEIKLLLAIETQILELNLDSERTCHFELPCANSIFWTKISNILNKTYYLRSLVMTDCCTY